jgi:hypothetical protein
LGQPVFSLLHQLASDSAAFVLWKQCDDEQLAIASVSHAEANSFADRRFPEPSFR